MKSRKYIILGILFLLILGGACNGSETPEPQGNTDDPLSVYARRDEVLYGKPDSMGKLLQLLTAKLNEGDNVKVENSGIAVIKIADAYSVELMHKGELQLEEVQLEGNSPLLKLSQSAGASLNKFNAEEVVNSRLQIVNDHLVVTATGTYFLVMQEENTPLQWVVALPDHDSELRVTADGTTAPVPVGKAVWVAPVGPPGPVFEADMIDVFAWISDLRDGNSVSEFGEVVWEPANVEVPMQDFPEPIIVSEAVLLNGIAFTLDPTGFYEKVDCNGDGLQDLHVQNGRIQLDFRQVIGQVRNIAVSIVNHQPDTPLSLTGFNPANEIISEASMTTTQTNDAETLTLFSPVQPFHYADLEIAEACLAAVQLIPPGEDIITVTPVVPHTPTPTATLSVCTVNPPYGWVQYFVQSGDTLFNLANRTGLTIEAIMTVNCLPNTTIYLNQPLWLPFIPPPLIPTSTPTLGYKPPPPYCTVSAEIVDLSSSGQWILNVFGDNLQNNTEYEIYVYVYDMSDRIDSLTSNAIGSAYETALLPNIYLQYPTFSLGLVAPESQNFACETLVDNNVRPTSLPTASFTPTFTPTPIITPTITNTPTATNTLIPTPNYAATLTAFAQLFEYFVGDGETILSIATKFGVSVQKLMDANGISDQNQNIEGQVLKIPR